MIGSIGSSLGDVTGIGPEVPLKALAAEAQTDDLRYVIIGDTAHISRLNWQLDLKLPLRPLAGAGATDHFLMHDPLRESLPVGLVAGSPAAARASLAWLKDGAERCLRHELDGLVTAPVNKESILHTGQAFIGQTEFLS